MATTHKGSRNNLLGPSPAEDQIKWFSNELQITGQTPPAFLVHASDDKGVPVGNSIRFYEELIKSSVPAELHIYFKGGHGFLSYPSFDEWIGRCQHWMKSNNWID